TWPFPRSGPPWVARLTRTSFLPAPHLTRCKRSAIGLCEKGRGRVGFLPMALPVTIRGQGGPIMADQESKPKLRRTDKRRLGVGVFLASFLGLLLAGCPNSDEGNEDNCRVLRGHDGPVLALAFAADGTLASAGADGTIRLWDAMAGSERTTLAGHVGR